MGNNVFEELMAGLDEREKTAEKSTNAARKAKAAIGAAVCDAVEGLTQEEAADVFSSMSEMLKVHAMIAAMGNTHIHETAMKAMREANRQINDELSKVAE